MVNLLKLRQLPRRIKFYLGSRKDYNYFMIIFVMLLVISIVICAVTINYTEGANIEISIEYNVGEIIAAILAGAGISSAGIAYAAKTIKEMNKEE